MMHEGQPRPEPKIGFEQQMQHRDALLRMTDLERDIWNEYHRMVAASPQIHSGTDAVIILGHGKLQPGQELPFDDATLEQSKEAVETKQRVIRSLSDLMVWKSGRDVPLPLVLVVGTKEQTDFMEQVAAQLLRHEDPSLRFPVVPVVSPGHIMTSTKDQLAAAFQALAETQHCHIAVFTSDYHVPRVERLAEQYMRERVRRSMHMDVLWVPWVSDRKRMNEDTAKAIMRDEIDRCLEYQKRGILPKW